MVRAYNQCLESIIIAQFHRPFFLSFGTQNQDMVHGFIGSGLIEIEISVIEIPVSYRVDAWLSGPLFVSHPRNSVPPCLPSHVTYNS